MLAKLRGRQRTLTSCCFNYAKAHKPFIPILWLAIDQVTQQNAALVQKAAGASASMLAQLMLR